MLEGRSSDQTLDSRLHNVPNQFLDHPGFQFCNLKSDFCIDVSHQRDFDSGLLQRAQVRLRSAAVGDNFL